MSYIDSFRENKVWKGGDLLHKMISDDRREYYKNIFYFVCDYITANKPIDHGANLCIFSIIYRILLISDITNNNTIEIINKIYKDSDNIKITVKYIRGYANSYIRRKKLEKINEHN